MLLKSNATLAQIVEPVQDELEQVVRLLDSQMRNRVERIDEILQYGNLLSGKRLRPIVLLLVAGAAGRIDARHIQLAAAVEMIHTATLVHDDLLDSASTRRHLPTIHHKWDSSTSILLGDYLFSNAFLLAASTGDARACQVIGQATNLVCEGELQQLSGISNLQLSESEYFEIISGKTGQLIACGSRLGTFFQSADACSCQSVGPAHHGGDQAGTLTPLPHEQQMLEFGQHLGIAFQIFDDILDLDGSSSSTGKTLHTDLANQKATLPLIRALASLPDSGKKQLSAHWSQLANGEGQAEILQLLRETGAIESSIATAREHADAARRCLSGLPQNACRRALERVTEFVANRRC